ncbi:MAG: HD domain-containing protein [Anaerolineae bacterium]
MDQLQRDLPMGDRLARQIAFLTEVERLKLVYRRNRTIDRSRYENSAEHSWHVALMALLLLEHANIDSLDIDRVVRMLLVHDLVEIYAGDTWLYDAEATEKQGEQEASSASRLCALLPDDQAAEFQSLWEEFELRRSPESVYAAAIDALQPLLNHLLAGDAEADESRPSRADVLARKRHIAESSEALWQLAQAVIDASTKQGLYR